MADEDHAAVVYDLAYSQVDELPLDGRLVCIAMRNKDMEGHLERLLPATGVRDGDLLAF
jgi:hypothetical protein